MTDQSPTGASGLPEPFVPADVDLSGYPYVPLYRTRLFGSEFFATANDAEFRAGVTLLLKSWDQRPSGSLPDDDVCLCRLAELGRDLPGWRAVKAKALHGWFRCADGRLYHAVVAEIVLAAWASKTKASKRGKAGAAVRWAKDDAPAMAQAMPAPMPGDGTSNAPTMAQAMPAPMPGDGTSNAPAMAHAMPAPMPGDGNRGEWSRTEGTKGSLRSPHMRARKAASRAEEPYPEDFAAVLAALPVAAGASKAKAWTSWKRSEGHRPPLADLIAAAKGYAAALTAENAKRPRDDQRSACSPATWIDERRWESFMASAPQVVATPAPRAWNHPAEDRLRADIGDALFQQWLAPCRLSADETVAVLAAPSRMVRDYVATKFLAKIERAFAPALVAIQWDPGAPHAPQDDALPDIPEFLRRKPESGVAA